MACTFATRLRLRLLLLRLPIIALALSAHPAPAQPPEPPPTATVEDDEPATTVDPDDGVFTVPETEVVGRLDSFPNQPLGEDQAIAPGRGAAPLSEYGGSVTVITREQILQTRQRLVGEVLRTTVGLDVARTGGPGGPTSVFLRGGNSNHTKVLIDGLPANDPSNPGRAFDFSNLSIDNIERIEVLRGPQSMVYGSDALGGVISITTRRGDGPARLASTTEGGTLGEWTQAFSYGGGDDTAYYSLAGSFHHTDGVTSAARRFGNTERDRFRQGNVSGRVGWNVAENVNVDYTFRWVDGDVEVDDFGVDNVFRQVLGNQFFTRLQAQSWHLDDMVTSKIGLNLTDSVRRDTDPEPFFGVPRFDGQSRQIDWQGQARLLENNTLVGGVDYFHEEADTTFVSQQAQNNVGVYIEDRFRLGERWYHTIGVRWDDHSSAGDANTYRYTSRLALDEYGASLHGSIGTGFRAPALAEILFPGGNSMLRPERSKGWDVGLRQQLGEYAWVDATYFRTDYDNLIVFDFNTFASQNIGQARASGVELTSAVDLTADARVLVAYTFNDTLDVAFGGPLPRRPQQKGSLTLSRDLFCDRATINLYALYVGHRIDFAQRFGGTELDDYWLVNLSGAYNLNECWQFYARIDNILDEDYEEAGGFDTPGITGVAGVRVDL